MVPAEHRLLNAQGLAEQRQCLVRAILLQLHPAQIGQIAGGLAVPLAMDGEVDTNGLIIEHY